MRQSVRDNFVRFSAPLEGVVSYMYKDVKNLVTVGMGQLIDPIQYAMQLPFVHIDGTPATKEEIALEWRRVKDAPELAKLGHLAAKKYTNLRLDSDGINLTVSKKLSQNDAHILARFKEWETWPADCQLGVMSMCWAMGPAFRWPMFEAALRIRDFGLAANQCKIDERGNPGVVPRNAANKLLFQNAAHVERHGLDPEILHWPKSLVDAVDTQPELPHFGDENEDRESGDHHEFSSDVPSVVPKSEGIFEAVKESIDAYRKSRDP